MRLCKEFFKDLLPCLGITVAVILWLIWMGHYVIKNPDIAVAVVTIVGTIWGYMLGALWYQFWQLWG